VGYNKQRSRELHISLRVLKFIDQSFLLLSRGMDFLSQVW